MNTQGFIGSREALVDAMSAKLGFKVHISDNNSRRARLWLVDPRCVYCGVETIWCQQSGQRLPDNAATREHLDSKISHRRRVRSRDPLNARSAIACNRCNFREGKKEEAQLPPEVRNRRSHLHGVPRHSRAWVRSQLPGL